MYSKRDRRSFRHFGMKNSCTTIANIYSCTYCTRFYWQ